MRHLRLLCCVALALSIARADPPKTPPPQIDNGNGRIVGGHIAEPGTVPWQVEMFNIYPWPPELIAPRPVWSKQHACGGVLIAPDMVLTAAHCIEDPEHMKGFRFLTSSQSLEGRGLQGGVGRVFKIKDDDYAVHPAYKGKSDNWRNDIAVIHIVPDPEARPAANPGPMRKIDVLPDSSSRPLKVGDEVSVTGWGSTVQRAGAVQADQLVYSPELQIADKLHIVAPLACVTDAKGLTIDICAAGEVENGKEMDACQGDSGGPLVRRRGYAPKPNEAELIGLVSWGAGCGLPGHKTYYTYVPAFQPWISAQIAKFRGHS